MTLGRRFELALANAAHNIPEARREELIEAVMQWIEKDSSPDCRTSEEQFYMLGAVAQITLLNYLEEMQAQIGGQILEREMAK